MALHFPPEWLDENLPEDFDPSDLSPYRALDQACRLCGRTIGETTPDYDRFGR